MFTTYKRLDNGLKRRNTINSDFSSKITEDKRCGFIMSMSTSVLTEFVDPSFCTTPGNSDAATEAKGSNTKELDRVIKNGNQDKIKAFIRDQHWGFRHEVRSVLWLRLFRLHHRDPGSFYEDMKKDIFGDGTKYHSDVPLPTFVDPSHMQHYHLSNHGIHIVKKIVCVLGHTNPDVTFSPVLFAIASVFLHYMSEADCFNCVYWLVRSREGSYLTQTKIGYDASKHVLRDLMKKYAKQAYTFLTSHHNGAIEDVLESWVWWIFRDLPFPYLVRILDCYLYEGSKILYRVALAILIRFQKYIERSNSNIDGSVKDAIAQFCEDIPVTVDKLLKVAFGIRGISRKEIARFGTKNEMFLKSQNNMAEVPHLPKSTSCESLDLKVSRSFSGPASTMQFNDVSSEVVSTSHLQTIYEWLPTRMTVYQPTLLFTTSEHGTSIGTLFSRCLEDEQTILVVKTTKNEIFGAYCSANWEERKQMDKKLSFFGTGETFLFSLHPQAVHYPWVGINSRGNVPFNQHMFMSGDHQGITIGGGGGGQGLQLDNNLDKGRTQKCDTFDNAPLASCEDFQCSVVEVFGFK
ncbi:unnamed protein product [Owenia fusiformis]|uniref:Uncharacterized protein n=1 Tax=Owenia fusiformis TaxID=6347 RepID=A0A8J1Y3C5_OWEFU|nr:unnamed protein product [Owenia fusiformis]